MRFIKSGAFLFLFCLAGIQTPAQEVVQKGSFKDRFSFQMIAKTELSYEFKSDQLQKWEFVLKPEFEYKFSKNLKLLGLGRFYLETTGRLEPGRPVQKGSVSAISRRLLLGDRAELELRELYLHARIKKKLRLRVGKQQVVWGETDGLKLLDLVNPQYFREFILDDFEDSRIPLWSVKAEFPLGKVKTQIVWIPDQTYHVLPDFNAPFFPGSLLPEGPPGVALDLLPANRPGNWLKDSDIGIRLAAFVKGWDLTFHYFYHYEDLPALYQMLSLKSSGQPLLTIQPAFERNHLLGATFNKPLSAVTLRGEVAYSFNRRFSSGEETSANGVIGSDNFLFALGFDYLSGDWLFSGQWFNDIILGEKRAFNRDAYEINFSLLISKSFWNDSFKVESLWVHNRNKGDGLLRPEISWWWSSNVELFLGADIFYGKKSGLFGQFKDRTRASMGVIWGI